MNNTPTFFGHPRGLATLFFTEMWERFSYYGMRALLLLFMVAGVDEGGLGFSDQTGAAIYGLYTMLVYLLALPGGWLADRLFGLRRAVFYGGCLIALGHICLAVPSTQTFFVGLLLIVMGTGLLKPNVSSLVGELYSAEEQSRRDSGFSIFYMGINLGAFSAPFITSYLGEKINWHWGFTAAALGMIAGLIQYRLTENRLGEAGHAPVYDTPEKRREKQRLVRGLVIFLVALAGLVTLLLTGVVHISPLGVAQASTYLIAACVVIYFVYLLSSSELTAQEKKKIAVIGIFFIFGSLFWGGYEQQGSSLNLFGERYTDRMIFGWEMPAGWLQSAPPIFVVIFSPIFAWLWLWLEKRRINPSTPVKFSFGLLFMGVGYAIMMGASLIVVAGNKALPTWLIMTYLLQTFGEICLYPVGLSAVTKLSPKKLVGRMMGIWFMSLSFGNLVAGLFAGQFDEHAIAADPHLLVSLFWVVVKGMVIAGLVILVFAKPIRKLMGEVK